MFNDENRTICAISSPAGMGAIAIVRLSGENSIKIASKLLSNKDKFFSLEHGKMLYTQIFGEDGKILDDVLLVKFIAPNSFTGENTVEIYCHGSEYIQSQIIITLINYGASVAKPGEFSFQAFFNSRIDLSQTEALADLISSSSRESHRLAINQMKGHISSEIAELREKMLELVALMELELDFGEEDVEFADRTKLSEITLELIERTSLLISSYKYGNAIKSGIPVAIVGEPNVGKSTLLNALLKDERAIVSHIPGTTRDTIEENLIIEGLKFRFIDTAGIRNSDDLVEKMGVKRTFENIEKSQVILLTIDANIVDSQTFEFISSIKSKINDDQYLLILLNKSDTVNNLNDEVFTKLADTISVSAKTRFNLDKLEQKLINWVKSLKTSESDLIITSSRQLELFQNINISLVRAKEGIDKGLSGDFVSQDLREAMYMLGEITGHITNDDVLGAIFSKFCIGK
ncbi:MAG: tRNA uridine-5-carboxymethylaminomethyl(34) synthesis GTPase MnmE [Bacteroidales bacterium]|nr:tRNA uridine-5-carboxymethylaminomethyl(34) synthesis GTPase MnmE [Bacteroidales bacterium]